MKKTAWLMVVAGAFLGLGTLSCGGSGSGPSNTGGPSDVAWTYPEHQFVISALTLPQSSTDAANLGFDLDGDGNTDNQLGNILSALSSSMGDASPQDSVDQSMLEGSIVVLMSVYAQDIQNSATSNLWAFLGEAANPPLTAGFADGYAGTVDATGPQNAYFGGKIKNGGGTFGGNLAQFQLNIPLTGGAPLELALNAVHVEFDVSADGKHLENGKLGGAIAESDLNTKVLPAVQGLLQDQLDTNCTYTAPNCTCTSGSGAATIQEMFDANGDCQVSLDEVQQNSIIKAFLKGDVTLKDANGNDYKALSLAVGFEAVSAKFDHAAPPTQ